MELLESGLVHGRVMVQGQQLPPLPSPSLIVSAGMNQNARQPWPIFWSRHDHARLVGPSLAPLDARKRLMIEAVYGMEFCRRDPSFNYTGLSRPVFLPGKWTSVVGTWSQGFYHWWTDVLPRLEMLSIFPGDVGILVRGPLRSYQKESLEMLGLLDQIRETPENHLIVEEYYFSSPVGMTGCTNPRSVRWLREKFLRHASSRSTPSRFFVSRESKTRGIANQKEIGAYLQSSGWSVVDLEKLTVAEQIAHFKNADTVIAEHGAGLTNILWCNPGCRILELCADNFLNGCYEGIALVNKIKHNFRVFSADASSCFAVPIEEIDAYISANSLKKENPAGTQ
jgi:hypothetical protein